MEYSSSSSSSSENLDDGELWLPSDIFPVEEPLPFNNSNNFINHHHHPISCSFCSCLHSLHHLQEANSAAAVSILDQLHQAHSTHTVPKPFPFITTQRRFRQAERGCTCTSCSVFECFEFINGGGREIFRTGPPPVYDPYQLYPPPPVQLQHHQVESLIEERTRFLQLQEKKNRFIEMHNLRRNMGLDRFVENRFLPFVEGGGGFNGESNFVRNYGGTGVFLPRVPTNIDNNGGKRQGGRNRQAKWSEVSTMHMMIRK